MTYLIALTDVDLITSGFTVDPYDSNHASRGDLDVYRCSRCGLWASILYGALGNAVCDSCTVESRPRRSRHYDGKIYHCCADDECPYWQTVLAILIAYGIDPELGIDVSGIYVNVAPECPWPKQKMSKFLAEIKPYCTTEFGGRQVKCPDWGPARFRNPPRR